MDKSKFDSSPQISYLGNKDKNLTPAIVLLKKILIKL